MKQEAEGRRQKSEVRKRKAREASRKQEGCTIGNDAKLAGMSLTHQPGASVKSRRAIGLALAAAAGLGCLLACGLGGFWAYRSLVGEPPGQGAQAQRGYQAAAPIIAALETYHQAHGQYPATLDTLVPAYLAAIPASVNGYPLTYQAVGGSYTLQFSYAGPGMNHCTYAPSTLWKCFGYY